MHHFTYQDGTLHCEGVDLNRIADEVGTPCYVYSTAPLVRHARVISAAFEGQDCLIAYSVKSNGNIGVLSTLAREGCGADVVSGGELQRALHAGIPAERIVFSGVGKTASEMRLALNAGIHQFNVESAAELRRLSEVASLTGVDAPVAIRVNPDVAAGGHPNISTGKKGDKFGVPWSDAEDLYAEAATLPGIKVVGVDVHIGSQLTDLEPYRAAFTKVAELTRALRADGHDIRRIDLGGGLGIPYEASNQAPPLPFDYGRVVHETVGDLDAEIEIEPGRLIAGNAGLLVSRVLYVKQGEGRDFLILDAAMNDLIRPAMYDAHHDIVPIVEPAPGAPRQPFDVVGPVCETGDTFARERALPPLSPGDLVAFRSAGAYGAVMASEYNSRPLVPEVMVNRDQFAVVRARPSFDEMISRDTIPEWLD